MTGGDQGHSRVTLHRLTLRSVEEERVVCLPALEHGQARGAVGHALHRDALDVGRVPPVRGKGLEDHVDPGPLAHELVRPRPDWPLPETVGAHRLEVLPGQHDAGGGGRRAIEGHEVGPRFFQLDAQGQRIHRLHLAHPRLELLRPRALVALEAPLGVVRRHGVAVVELEATAKLELVGQPVRALRPRLGQARSHLLPGQRTHQRVVDCVEHAEGRDLGRRRRGIEPARGKGDVEGHGDLTRRRRAARGRLGE